MNPELHLFTKILKENQLFATTPRIALFECLQTRGEQSIGQLISALPKQDKVTIYRNLTLFNKLGVTVKLYLGSQSKIELSDMFKHHHHHLTCNSCHKIFALPDDTAIETAISNLTNCLPAGFKITDHQLELRGICNKCQ